MRKSCLDCVRKHIAQAGIMAMETLMGHPEHYWWVIGHLAEAEHEALEWFPQLAVLIRIERLEYMENKFHALPIDGMLSEADGYGIEEAAHVEKEIQEAGIEEAKTT